MRIIALCIQSKAKISIPINAKSYNQDYDLSAFIEPISSRNFGFCG